MEMYFVTRTVRGDNCQTSFTSFLKRVYSRRKEFAPTEQIIFFSNALFFSMAVIRVALLVKSDQKYTKSI